MVPEPEFESYYGRPILKTPTWKTPDVPLYLFLGGLAGASALLAEGAALRACPALERVARLAAAAGAAPAPSPWSTTSGRPERFLNMLRVFKPTSPLSVGSFILAPFCALSAAAAGSEVTGRLPRLGRLAGLGAAALGPPLATYTAALVANTAVPAWHEATASCRSSSPARAPRPPVGWRWCSRPCAGRAGPPDGRRRRRDRDRGRRDCSTRLGMVAEPYQQGRPGRLMNAARAADRGRRGRHARRAAVARGSSRCWPAPTCVAASVLTRFGVFEAGLASARDPKYIVVPQRERLARPRRPRAAGGAAH